MSIGASNIDPAQNVLLRALATDQMWTVTTIEYGFRPGGTTYEGDEGPETAETFSTAERRWIRDELAEISTVAALEFVEVAFHRASLDFVKEEEIGDDTLGYATLPENNYSEIVLDADFIIDFDTAIHEIGHALGLDHPFDDIKLPGVADDESKGQFSLNNPLYTVMAYNDPKLYEVPDFEFPNALNLAALDIAALQAMYGANTTYANGHDIYAKPDEIISIWDTDGRDRIDFRAETAATVINLNAATLELKPGGAGRASYVQDAGPDNLNGSYTIAYGVVIEHGFGGAGQDRINGNDVDNFLTGGAGADKIYGKAGDDRLHGDAGNDLLRGGDGDDVALGGTGNDVLEGEDGADRLVGNGGNDTLNGGAGADALIGGNGIDRATYFDAATGVRADLRFEDRNSGEAAGDTYQSVERLFGSNHDDVLGGDDRGNLLSGGAGDDILTGRSGRDDLRGGAGDDRLTGGRGSDEMTGGAGEDTFVFAANDGADRVMDYDDADDYFQFAIAGLGFSDLEFSDTANGAVINYGSGTVTLAGVTTSVLSEDDFVFG